MFHHRGVSHLIRVTLPLSVSNWVTGHFLGVKTPVTMILEKLLREETLITGLQRYWDGIRSKAASLRSNSLVPYEDSQSGHHDFSKSDYTGMEN